MQYSNNYTIIQIHFPRIEIIAYEIISKETGYELFNNYNIVNRYYSKME